MRRRAKTCIFAVELFIPTLPPLSRCCLLAESPVGQVARRDRVFDCGPREFRHDPEGILCTHPWQERREHMFAEEFCPEVRSICHPYHNVKTQPKMDIMAKES